MLDIKLFRESPDKVKEMLEKRRMFDYLDKVDSVVELDKRWRSCLRETDNYRAKRNNLTSEVKNRRNSNMEFGDLVEQAKQSEEKLIELEKELRQITSERSEMLKIFPNMIHNSVPEGLDENNNVPIKWVGKPRVWEGHRDIFKNHNNGFTVEPLYVEKEQMHHADIVNKYSLVDLDSAAVNAGSRFCYETNELVDLDLALVAFGFNKIRKRGFKAVIPPYLVKKQVEEGGTDIGVFEETLYKIEGDDLYLIPTSEHPIASMVANKDINENELPIRFVAFSPCFRREAGSHGKDTKGIFRVHQFHKIEEYSVAHPDESYKELEFLREISEEITKDLEIPYRVTFLCTGDMDKKVTKQYDIEGWFPAQGSYRELTSTGNVTDWQSRRLGIKYRKKNHNLDYPHTVYSTGIAVQRAMTCILENNMQDDGSIKMPAVLRPYLSFEEIAPNDKI